MTGPLAQPGRAFLWAAMLGAGLLSLLACSDEQRRERVASTPRVPASSSPSATAGPAAPTPASTATPAAQAGAGAASAAALGGLLIPVAGVHFGMLRDDYDDVRGSGRHEALDIMAPRGTPVFAVADGPVAKLFTSQAGGLTVYQFDGSRTLAYYYAHLDSYADGLREGLELKRGDPIGTVGSTGNAKADAPHLHFAVFLLGPQREWWKGTPINPYPLFAPAR